MKITVELSDNDLSDVMRFSGERKKGPAIRTFVVNELTLKRRRELLEKTMSGMSRIALPAWSTSRRQDRKDPWAR